MKATMKMLGALLLSVAMGGGVMAQTIVNDGGSTSYQNGADASTLFNSNIVGTTNVVQKDTNDGDPGAMSISGSSVVGNGNTLNFSPASQVQNSAIVGNSNTINQGVEHNGYLYIFGSGNSASGRTVTITGHSNNVTGNGHFVGGNFNAVTGQQSLVSGVQNTVSGTINSVYGDFNTVGGMYSSVSGLLNNVSGGVNQVNGYSNTVGGYYNSVLGSNNNVTSNYSQSVGNWITNTHDNAVVLGNGSVSAGDNTVSVGAAGQERRIANVADGQAPTDAATVRQVGAAEESAVSRANSYTNMRATTTLRSANTYTDTRVANAIQQANTYTDSLVAPLQGRVGALESRMNSLDARISEVRREARQGAVMAAVMIPMAPSRLGASNLNLSVAGFGSEAGIGASMARRTGEDTVIHVSGALAGTSSMWKVGVSHEF